MLYIIETQIDAGILYLRQDFDGELSWTRDAREARPYAVAAMPSAWLH